MGSPPQSATEAQGPGRPATDAPRPVTAREGAAALRAMAGANNDPNLVAQAQVYARGNRLGSVTSESFWRNLPPQVAQAVLEGRYEATKAFFETWGKSIAHNAREGKRASQQALDNAQRQALEALNSALRRP